MKAVIKVKCFTDKQKGIILMSLHKTIASETMRAIPFIKYLDAG